MEIEPLKQFIPLSRQTFISQDLLSDTHFIPNLISMQPVLLNQDL